MGPAIGSGEVARGDRSEGYGARIKLTIAYDGTRFAGSQRQPGQRTVQAELESAYHRLTGRLETVTLAGRTDAGVHAVGQVGSMPDLVPHLSPNALVRAFGGLLPDDLSVWQVERAGGAFHARFDARWREYRYRIWEGPLSPAHRDRAWQRDRGLDVAAMVAAGNRLVGERDFGSIANLPPAAPARDHHHAAPSMVRTVYACQVARVSDPWDVRTGAGELVEIRVVASGFLRRMVRTIVAVLVAVGRGRHDVSWVERILADRAERQATRVAPPHGLTLWRVGYDDDDWQRVGRA